MMGMYGIARCKLCAKRLNVRNETSETAMDAANKPAARVKTVILLS